MKPILVALIVSAPIWSAHTLRAQQIPSDELQQDESQQVVQAIVSYVEAFNRRDAEAVSQHWSVDGEMIDSLGERRVGRPAIREAMESVFQNLPDDIALSLKVTSVSFVTPEVAIERGVATMPGSPAVTYQATHRKEDGRWVLFTVSDHSSASSDSQPSPLLELEWLLGDWEDSDQEGTVRSSYNWSRNRHFINQNFRVSVPGMEPLEGTQVIGYDASSKTIRSWLFDSDGGTGQGVWRKDGDRWVVKMKQVLADGRKASAVNIYQPTGDGNIRWQSTRRMVDGQSLPDTDPVIVQREPSREPGNLA